MAKYNLLCTNDHTFEGWFASEKDYLQQKKKKMIACPMCDDTQIRRALMAPNINTKSVPKEIQHFLMAEPQLSIYAVGYLKTVKMWVNVLLPNAGKQRLVNVMTIYTVQQLIKKLKNYTTKE